LVEVDEEAEADASADGDSGDFLHESMRQEFVYVKYIDDDIPNRTPMQIKITSSITSHYQYKFQEIMRLDGIEPKDIKNSLNIEKNCKMIFKAGEGAGSSGSFFFFSHDNRFIIKTL